MAVPKKRHSKSKVGRRRQHIFLKKPTLSKCPKCANFVLPHTLCSFCGYYKGKEVIDVLGKMDKKERKQREKDMKVKDKTEEGTKKKRSLSWKELSKRQ